MLYDTIILGATFTAAGIASKSSGNSLIIDRRPHAGYEFINALSFGSCGTPEPVTEQAKALKSQFRSRGAYDSGKPCLFPCAPVLYQILEDCNVLLNTEILCVDRSDAGWVVTTHSVSGYRTFRAKHVVDTRVLPHQIQSKSLNLLINRDDGTAPQLPQQWVTENWGYDADVVVKCPVSVDADYLRARTALADLLRQLPEGCKAALIADCFDYVLKEVILKESDGITYLPSKQYADPILAFDAGVRYAMGGEA